EEAEASEGHVRQARREGGVERSQHRQESRRGERVRALRSSPAQPAVEREQRRRLKARKEQGESLIVPASRDRRQTGVEQRQAEGILGMRKPVLRQPQARRNSAREEERPPLQSP